MEYIISNLRGVTLGEPPEKLDSFDESTIKQNVLNTFNNSDYVATITIKGAHRHRFLASNTQAQFSLMIKIKDIIEDYSQYYIINYEMHKCNEWIHSHFIFRPKFRSKVPKMRKEIYALIEGTPLKRKSYRHRILIEKPYKISLYTEYIFKCFEDMQYYNIHPHYKLKSTTLYTPCLELGTSNVDSPTVSEEETNTGLRPKQK